MKYLVILLLLIGITGSFLFGNYAYGWWIPLSSEELIEQSKTIFVGTVTAITPVDVEYQSKFARNGTVKDSVGPEVMTLEEYTVDVEEYLKNPQESDTITVLRATVGGVPSGPAKISGFEIGERVLFYLPKDEKQTHFSEQYLPESFKIPKQCDAKSVLEQPRIIGANDFRVVQYGISTETNFTANKSIHFIFNKDMRTLDGAGFNVTVTIAKTNEDKTRDVVLSKTIHAESKPCEWIASAELEFVPTAGEYYKTVQITQGTTEEVYSGPFSVVEGFSEIAKDNPCFNVEENRHAPCNPDESLKFYDYMGKQWMEAKKQEMLDAFVADKFHEWIDQTENYFHWNVYQYYSYTEDLTKFLVYPSPFKQLRLGIEPQDINCKSGLFLIQKHDGTPACVSPETKQELIKRGWTNETETSMLPKIDVDSSDRIEREVGYLGLLMLMPYVEQDEIVVVALEGRPNFVKQVVDYYDIKTLSNKTTPDDSFSSIFGNITKANLQRFFEENPMNHFLKRGLSFYSVGSFTNDTGTYGPFNEFLTDIEGEKIGKILQVYENKRTNMEDIDWSKIIKWPTGEISDEFSLDDFIENEKSEPEPTVKDEQQPIKEHYEIEIIGLKDEYAIGEEYSFYFVISGYGYACASHEATYPDENGNIMKTSVDVLCGAKQSMQEFEINYLERKGTLGNVAIKNPGTYTVTVIFEKPNKYFPTTVSKDFRVVEN